MATQRSCARCGKELTDAASMDMGVGPSCRGLDNALLASSIRFRQADAVEAARRFDAGLLPPECRDTWGLVEEELSALAEQGKDWRKTVKRIEWLLSWGVDGAHVLVDVVDALGYVGLAAVWRGDAAKGLCLLWLVGENATARLYLSGPRHSAARTATKAIQGWQWHPHHAPAPADSSTLRAGDFVPCWSVPAVSAEAFRLLVLRHYPNYRVCGGLANLDELVVRALDVVGVVAARMERVGIGLRIETPFRHEGFVAELKTVVPWQERRWNGSHWEVDGQHESTVRELLRRAFGRVEEVQPCAS